MTTIIADTSALAAAAESGFLELLPECFERIILSPAVVDELIEIEVIDALMATSVEQMIEVVSLTRQDEEQALELARLIARESVNGDEGLHTGEAEALALMGRADLEPLLCLCDDQAALTVARSQNIATRSFLSLVNERKGEQAAGAVRAAPRAHEPGEPVEGLVGTDGDGDSGASPRNGSSLGDVGEDQEAGSYESGSPFALGTRLEEPLSDALDPETQWLIERLIDREVGEDARDVIRRAVRAMAVAFDLI